MILYAIAIWFVVAVILFAAIVYRISRNPERSYPMTSGIPENERPVNK